jgi:hypothetical protein
MPAPRGTQPTTTQPITVCIGISSRAPMSGVAAMAVRSTVMHAFRGYPEIVSGHRRCFNPNNLMRPSQQECPIDAGRRIVR